MNSNSNSVLTSNKYETKFSSIINRICQVLEQLCTVSINTKPIIPMDSNLNNHFLLNAINLFNLKTLPNLSFKEYLEKSIVSLTNEENTIIYSLIVLDRFISSGIILTKYNLFLSFLVSFLISVKINEDKIYADNVYAKLGGIDLKTLSTLEKIFLDVVGYNIIVSEEDFKIYKSSF